MSKKYRVIQWATGHVGKHALRAIANHPQMELAGLWVSSEAKAGKDAGELCGAGRTGVTATRDAEAMLALDADCVSYAAATDYRLGDAIDDLEAAGRPTEEARTGWWHKISGPLSTVLMPLLAATAAFGLARSGKVLLRATIGMALGFAYFVADNFSLALGNYGAYPPFLAAWAPFLLFLLIGEFVLVRQEE